MYVHLGVIGDDVAAWAAGFGCSVETIDPWLLPENAERLTPPAASEAAYRISGSAEQLERLLADGGYDPDTEIC